MNKSFGYLILMITLILSISICGCVAPPVEQKVKPIDNYDPNQVSTTGTAETPVSSYVTIETPYITLEPVSASNSTNSAVYRTLPPITQIPEDYVLIYSVKNQPFSYNKTAVSFDLKNPPMLIDFDVTAANITGERSMTGKYGDDAGKDILVATDYLDPSAWFEVTVREKNSGTITLQDGFGQIKQYGSEHPRHLKLLKTGNYLIEFSGNKLTVDLNLSVKREGNINQSVG